MRVTPFEQDLGWTPKSPLDCLSSRQTNIESLSDFKSRLDESAKDARSSIKLAQARQASYSKQRTIYPTYQVGDKVWLSKTCFRDKIASMGSSQKLGKRRYGPFHIQRLIGKNAVELDIPSHYLIHRVVHVEHTKPYFVQPPDICQPPTEDQHSYMGSDGRLQYKVASILSHRRIKNRYTWLTRMEGKPRHEAAWLSTSDFIDDDGTTTQAFLDYLKANNMTLYRQRGRRLWEVRTVQQT